MSMIRVVHYVNQFFGGIGGEDKADVSFQIREDAVGPAVGLDHAFADEAAVVATLICGDNFFQSHLEEARASVKQALAKFNPDVVVAGPAFNAGRYGMACGEQEKCVALPQNSAYRRSRACIHRIRLSICIVVMFTSCRPGTPQRPCEISSQGSPILL